MGWGGLLAWRCSCLRWSWPTRRSASDLIESCPAGPSWIHSWDTEKLNRCAPFAAYDNFVAQRESVLRTFVLNNKQNKNLRVASSHPLGAMTAEEAFLWEKLDLTRLPRHVAVIMDGNGRWAQKRHLPRIAGHRSGRNRRAQRLRLARD